MNPSELAELDALGVVEVQRLIAGGHFGRSVDSPRRLEVEAWVKAALLESDGAATARRDARDEAMLSIARKASSEAAEANKIARRANNIAISAIICAAITAASMAFFQVK